MSLTDSRRMWKLAAREWVEQTGRQPTVKEWKLVRAQPSVYFIRKAYGSWRAALEDAGLTPVKPGQNAPAPDIGGPDRLPLTSRHGVVGWTQLDPEDRERFVGRHLNLGTDGYAYLRWNGRQTALHRLLLDPGDLDVDHINGDRLDNRRENLRVVTRAQNLENRTAPATGRSRFRGVAWSAQQGKWQAKGTRNNRTVYIGIFDGELDAAVAAQRWRDEHMPFAQPDPELIRLLGSWPAPADSEEVALCH